MRAALLGSGGPVLGREYPLDADLVTIGRRDENTIVIKDPTVSRKHAEIRREGDDFLVVDKNSTSGVLLNGVPVSGAERLKDGDRLGIGMSAIFLVRMQPAEEATVTFAQPQSGDRERTQFITRTDFDDPRGVVADPPPPAASAAPVPNPPREAPPPVAPPREAPTFSPPPAPQSVPVREVSPAATPPAAPGYASPAMGSATPPPPHSAAPPPPFSAAPTPPQYTPPPYAPPPAPSMGQGSAPWAAQQSASASVVAPPARSRRGMMIGLILLVLIIVVVLAIIGFVLAQR